jgi:hypothetical protein
MACTGREVTVQRRYWTWCRAGIVPYPCRKSRTVTVYEYDFTPTRTRVTWPLRCQWEGCCGGSRYTWSYWCWRGTGDSAWDQFNTVTRQFDSPLNPIGPCPVPAEGIG